MAANDRDKHPDGRDKHPDGRVPKAVDKGKGIAKEDKPKRKTARKGPKARAARHRSRNKQRKVGAGRDLVAENAENAMRAMHRLVDELAKQRGLAGDLPLETIDVALGISTRRADRGGAAEALVKAITARIDDALKASGGWRQGHVYCFQCDEPGCRHSVPPQPAATFAGYNGTGRPVWVGFAELCIERGDDRIHKVFADTPQVIALVQDGASLSPDVLPEFGGAGNALSVVGQVVAGLLPAAYAPGDGHDRVALTVQVVQMPDAGRRGRFRLNLLGTSWEGIAAVLATEGAHSPAEGLRSAIAAARHRLEAQSRHLRKREKAAENTDPHAGAMAVLTDLQRDIERVFRGHKWRTRHAEHRHRSGKRPTVTAVGEARNAPDNRLLHDINRKTIVVLGRKGRAHVFSQQGKHVTSLQLGPGEINRKTTRGRWRPLDKDTARAFREAVQARGDQTAQQAP